MDKTIKNLHWLKDDCGDYWVADLYQNGIKIGITGNYYSVDEKNQRASQEDQKFELKERFGYGSR